MDEPTAARLRRVLTVVALVAVLSAVVMSSASGSSRPRLLVVGNSAVAGAQTEIARRFRQDGVAVDIGIVDQAECADLSSRASGYERVVVSFDDWTGCGPWPTQTTMLVEQPGRTQIDPDAARGVTVRPASILFDGNSRVPCAWWDTPGAGEQVAGLGRCEPDGQVTVFESGLDAGEGSGTLTPAGNERFARMIVESVS